MITIFKGAKVYAPACLGEKDVLVIGGKIAAMGDNISVDSQGVIDTAVIDAHGKVLVPGLIDSHVHILGGGGEGGFATRTPEITLTDITTGGITTVVGCMGTDGVTRNMASLLAKARGLEEEGITTFIYSGSYRVPTVTITGEVIKDIMMIDKIIGVGEIAISDHRSSQPTLEEIKRLAADTRVGGMLAGKAGILNMHLGDSRRMLDMLFSIVEETEIPFSQFLPTHLNRNPYLFEEAIRYGKAGGFIDFTTSSDPSFWEDGEVKASKAVKRCLDEGVPIERMTFSSDGQGSLPVFNEKKELCRLTVGQVKSIIAELRDVVLEEKIPLETALKLVTENPAAILKLKAKGRIEKSFDADLVLLDESTLEIDTVMAKGKIMLLNKKIEAFGTFEIM